MIFETILLKVLLPAALVFHVVLSLHIVIKSFFFFATFKRSSEGVIWPAWNRRIPLKLLLPFFASSIGTVYLLTSDVDIGFRLQLFYLFQLIDAFAILTFSVSMTSLSRRATYSFVLPAAIVFGCMLAVVFLEQANLKKALFLLASFCLGGLLSYILYYLTHWGAILTTQNHNSTTSKKGPGINP